MKQPKTAPTLSELIPLMSELSKDADAFSAFQNAMVSPLVGTRYRHWDKLQHLSPPPKLDHRNWWLALKLARAGGRKRIPLADRRGFPFSYVLPDPAQELLFSLSTDLGASLELPEKITNPHTRDAYCVSSLIEESITSSQLEGAVTTRKVAEDMLRSGREPRNKSERMIVNNFAAMQRIGELCKVPLKPEHVFELHSVLCDGTLDNPDDAGRFRRANENIAVWDNVANEILHVPPVADQLPARLKQLCEFANAGSKEGFVAPMIRAILIHFWLAYDHPFVDGNGRTARALFYWSMRRAGHWLSEFVSISSVIKKGPARYAKAFLYTESDEGDLTYFILYHLDVLRQATDALHRYIKRKVEQVGRLSEILHSSAGLNHRQRELLAHALRHPRQEYTIDSHRRSHNVVYQTARRDLLELESLNYLVRLKRGQEFVFIPARDLEQKLERR